jgi:hypothetical protein
MAKRSKSQANKQAKLQQRKGNGQEPSSVPTNPHWQPNGAGKANRPANAGIRFQSRPKSVTKIYWRH